MRYIVEFGYTGGDPDVCCTLQDLSPEARTTSPKEYIVGEDWSILEQHERRLRRMRHCVLVNDSQVYHTYKQTRNFWADFLRSLPHRDKLIARKNLELGNPRCFLRLCAVGLLQKELVAVKTWLLRAVHITVKFFVVLLR